MKSILSIIILLFFIESHAAAQEVIRSKDPYTGDSIISTGFDTLAAAEPGSKTSIADRVVAVKTIHKGKATYYLFFYFSTSDITDKPVKIGPKNYAYFVKTNNEYLRFPYSGRAFNYSAKDNAGFFIDITKSLDKFRDSAFKMVRFETSQYYHELKLPEDKTMQIANVVNRLLQ